MNDVRKEDDHCTKYKLMTMMISKKLYKLTSARANYNNNNNNDTHKR